MSLVPCFLGGHPGVVKLVVIDEDIPHLLSAGLLEHAGAVMNMKSNHITFENLHTGSKMDRLDSGHRILNIVEGAHQFDIPHK